MEWDGEAPLIRRHASLNAISTPFITRSNSPQADDASSIPSLRSYYRSRSTPRGGSRSLTSSPQRGYNLAPPREKTPPRPITQPQERTPVSRHRSSAMGDAEYLSTPSWEMLTGGGSPSGVDIWNRRESKDKNKFCRGSSMPAETSTDFTPRAEKDVIESQGWPSRSVAVASQVLTSTPESTPVRTPVSAARNRHRKTTPCNPLTTIPSGDATPISPSCVTPQRATRESRRDVRSVASPDSDVAWLETYKAALHRSMREIKVAASCLLEGTNAPYCRGQEQRRSKGSRDETGGSFPNSGVSTPVPDHSWQPPSELSTTSQKKGGKEDLSSHQLWNKGMEVVHPMEPSPPPPSTPPVSSENPILLEALDALRAAISSLVSLDGEVGGKVRGVGAGMSLPWISRREGAEVDAILRSLGMWMSSEAHKMTKRMPIAHAELAVMLQQVAAAHKHRARVEMRSLSAFAQQTLNLQMGRVIEIFERQVNALNGWVKEDQSAVWLDAVMGEAEGRLLDWLNSRDLTTGGSKGLATYELPAGNGKEFSAAWQTIKARASNCLRGHVGGWLSPTALRKIEKELSANLNSLAQAYNVTA